MYSQKGRKTLWTRWSQEVTTVCRWKDSSDRQGGIIPFLTGCRGCESLVPEMCEGKGNCVLVVINVGKLAQQSKRIGGRSITNGSCHSGVDKPNSLDELGGYIDNVSTSQGMMRWQNRDLVFRMWGCMWPINMFTKSFPITRIQSTLKAFL